MAKYDPLETHLAGLPSHRREIILSFERIREIIAASLPDAAYHHRAWWGNEKNGSHVQAHSWLKAGWKVETVDQENYWTRFQRITFFN